MVNAVELLRNLIRGALFAVTALLALLLGGRVLHEKVKLHLVSGGVSDLVTSFHPLIALIVAGTAVAASIAFLSKVSERFLNSKAHEHLSLISLIIVELTGFVVFLAGIRYFVNLEIGIGQIKAGLLTQLLAILVIILGVSLIVALINRGGNDG